MSGNGYKIHSVKYNLIMNVILKMSAFIFPLITFPYVSRVLGPVGNGKVSFAISVIYYFTMIATLGIPTYGVKICAQFRDDKKKLSKTVKELLTIECCTMVLSYFIFFLTLLFVPRLQEDKYLMLINSISIALTVLGVEWFYQAIEQYDYITFRNLAFKVFSIVLMFVFVHKSEDYILYGAISIIGTVGSNILNIIRLRKFVHFKDCGKIELYPHIRPIFMLFMLSASTMVYTSLDTVMLGFIKGDDAIGYYNAAVKLKNIMVSLVTALGTVLLPRLSHSLANHDMEQFTRLLRKSFNFVCIVSLPLSLYCILEANACIDFLAGTGYSPSVLPMQLISPAIIFIGLSNIIGVQILIPLGKEKLTVISTIIGALINVILNSFFIFNFSSAGAALATTIAELCVLLVQVYYIRNKIKEIVEIKNISKIVVAVIISAVLVIVNDYFININSSFLSIMESGILFFSAYGILLLIFKENMLTELRRGFSLKLKKHSSSL